MENTGLFNVEGKKLTINEVMNILPFSMVNRVEVIDENGRSYVNWKSENDISLQIQDDGKTLKIFISQKDNMTLIEKLSKMEINTHLKIGDYNIYYSIANGCENNNLNFDIFGLDGIEGEYLTKEDVIKFINDKNINV